LAIDGQALVLTVGPSTSGTGAYVWSAASGGNWSDAAKWVAAPGAGAAGAVVRFDTTITGDAAVTLDQDATVGQLYLNSSNAYALAGAGHALSLDNGASSALVHLEQGKHAITAPIALAAGSSTTVKPFTGAALALTGAVSGDGGLVKDGAGELSLGASGNTFTGGVRLVSYGPLVLTNAPSAGTGPVAFESASTLRTGGTAPVSAAGGLDVRTTGLATVDVAAQAPLTASGLGVLAGTSLTKTGAGELIFADSATVESDTSAMLSIKQGTVRFASGSTTASARRRGRRLSGQQQRRLERRGRGCGARPFRSRPLHGLRVQHAECRGRGSSRWPGRSTATRSRCAFRTTRRRIASSSTRAACSPRRRAAASSTSACAAPPSCSSTAARRPSEAWRWAITALPGKPSAPLRHVRVREAASSTWPTAGGMADSNNASRVNWLLADGGGTARLPNTLRCMGPAGRFSGSTTHASGCRHGAGCACGGQLPVRPQDLLRRLRRRHRGHRRQGRGAPADDRLRCDARLHQGRRRHADARADAEMAGRRRRAGRRAERGADFRRRLRALPTNLLARYSSEGGPGIDSSGNTRHGAAWGSALTAVTDPFGGSALNFPTGSIIAMPMDAVMRGMGTYTVSMWVKAGSVSGTGGTFFTTRMGNSNDAYQFMLRINSGKFRYMATGSTYNGWQTTLLTPPRACR
jgi:autotransporter-associated beta strand protein